MIIIMLSGGLGNQMFQYALYCRLQELGRLVKVDDKRGFEGDPNGRRPLLTEVFGIEYEIASDKEVKDMLDSHKDVFSIVRRKLFGRKSKRYKEKSGNFDPQVLEIDDVYLDGYWQTDRYFDTDTVVARLKKDFYLDPVKIIQSEKEKKLLQDIEKTESVSVHVRRGDYLNPGTVETHGGICTDDYYKEALEKIAENRTSPTFYYFSNDKKWMSDNIKGDNNVVVDIDADEPQSDIVEMLLMSRCQDQILANSSYSWWSAWLNDREGKKIYVPSKWINNKEMDDIYTDYMIRI